MKNALILTLLTFLISLSSCSDNQLIIGSGVTASEFRNIEPFSKVSSKGVFDVTITQGAVQSIEVIANKNIIHKIKTKVVGDELRLSLDDNTNYRNLNLDVIITVPSITSINNSGVGDITIYDVNTAGDFYVYNSGTGNIRVEGDAERLTVENKGTGDFKGFQFMVSKCELEIIGTGDCQVTVSNELDLDIKGSGDVHYKGSPTIDAKISGSGKVVNAN